MKHLAKFMFLPIFAAFVTLASAECPNQETITSGLNNANQHGNFYFVPLNLKGVFSHWTSDFPNASLGSDGEFLTCVLDQFEKKFNADVVTFQLARDQDARDAIPRIWGILIKATPKPKPVPKTKGCEANIPGPTM
jgi:hypothetical protein